MKNNILKSKHLKQIIKLLERLNISNVEHLTKMHCFMMLSDKVFLNINYNSSLVDSKYILNSIINIITNLLQQLTILPRKSTNFNEICANMQSFSEEIVQIKDFISSVFKIILHMINSENHCLHYYLSWNIDATEYELLKNMFLNILSQLNSHCNSYWDYYQKITHIDHPSTDPQYYLYSAKNYDVIVAAKSCMTDYHNISSLIIDFASNSPNLFIKDVTLSLMNQIIEKESEISFALQYALFNQLFVSPFFDSILKLLDKIELFPIIIRLLTPIIKEMSKHHEYHTECTKEVKDIILKVIEVVHSSLQYQNVFNFLTKFTEYSFLIGCYENDIISFRVIGKLLNFSPITYPRTTEYFNFLEYCISKNAEIVNDDNFMEQFLYFMPDNFNKCLEILEKTSFSSDYFANRKYFMKIANICYQNLPSCSSHTRTFIIQLIKTLTPKQFNNLSALTLNADDEVMLSLCNNQYSASVDAQRFTTEFLVNFSGSKYDSDIYKAVVIEMFSHSMSNARARFIAHFMVDGLLTKINLIDLSQIYPKILSKPAYIAYILFSAFQHNVNIDKITTLDIFASSTGIDSIIYELLLLYEFYPQHNGYISLKIAEFLGSILEIKKLTSNPYIEFVNSHVIPFATTKYPLLLDSSLIYPEISCFDEKIRRIFEISHNISFIKENNNAELKLLITQESIESRIFLANCVNPKTTDAKQTILDLLNDGKYETAGLLLRSYHDLSFSFDINMFMQDLIKNQSDTISLYIYRAKQFENEEISKIIPIVNGAILRGSPIKAIQATLFVNILQSEKSNFVFNTAIELNNIEKLIVTYRVDHESVCQQIIEFLDKFANILEDNGNYNAKLIDDVEKLIDIILSSDVSQFIVRDSRIILPLLKLCRILPSSFEKFVALYQNNLSLVSKFIHEHINDENISDLMILYELIEKYDCKKNSSTYEKNLIEKKPSSVLSLILFCKSSSDSIDHRLDSIIRLYFPRSMKYLIKIPNLFKEKNLQFLLDFYRQKFYIGIIELVPYIIDSGDPRAISVVEKFFLDFVSHGKHNRADIINLASKLKPKYKKMFLHFLAKSIYKFNIQKYSKDPIQCMPYFSLETLLKNAMQDKAGGSFERLITSLHFYVDDNAVTALQNTRLWNSIDADGMEKWRDAYFRFANYPNIVCKLFEMIQEDTYENYHIDIFKEVYVHQTLVIRAKSDPKQIYQYLNVINVIINSIGKSYLKFDKMFQANIAQHIAITLAEMTNGYVDDWIMCQNKNIFKWMNIFVENTFKAMPFVESVFKAAKQVLPKAHENPKRSKMLLECLGFITRFTSNSIPHDLVEIFLDLSLEEKGEIWPYGVLALSGCLDANEKLLKSVIPKFYEKKIVYRIFPMLNVLAVNAENKTMAMANFAIAFAKSYDVNTSFDPTYFLGIIFEIKSADIFELIKKELQIARNTIDLVESRRYIFNLFVAIFTSGIQNKYLKNLVNDSLSQPEVIKVFKDYPAYSRFIYERVKNASKLKMLTTIPIDGEINLTNSTVREHPEQFSELTSIVVAMFSKKQTVKSYMTLLKSNLNFKLKKISVTRDFYVDIKIGVESVFDHELGKWPALQSSTVEYLSSKVSKISLSTLAALLGYSSIALENSNMQKNEDFNAKIIKILKNLFNSTNEAKMNMLSNVDQQVSFTGSLREFMIRAVLAQEFKSALSGNGLFNYTLPHCIPQVYHSAYKILRSQWCEVEDPQLESIHQKMFDKSAFLYGCEMKMIKENVDYKNLTAENMKSFILNKISLADYKTDNSFGQQIRAALRLSTSDILLAALYNSGFDPNWSVPFEWSPLFLSKRGNVPYVSSAFYLSMPTDFVPTDALPSIETFRAFISRISDINLVQEIKSADAIDYSSSEQFRRATMNKENYTPRTSFLLETYHPFVVHSSFNNLRAPLIRDNVNLLTATASVKLPEDNHITVDGRLSNGKSCKYILSYRDNFDSRFHVFCQAISRILKKSPSATLRSMIVSSFPVCRVGDFTMILTNGKPLLPKIGMFRAKPPKVHKRVKEVKFMTTKEKCEWQRILISRVAALSVLQYIVSSPVPNPYNLFIDFSNASVSAANLRISVDDEDNFIFPKLTGHIKKYLGIFDGQMSISMQSAAVSMMMFTHNIKVLAHALMGFSVEDTEMIEAALDDIGNISKERYADSFQSINKLIEQGTNEEIEYAIPWL